MNPGQVGALAEAKVLNRLLYEGYIVSRPWTNCPYDFVTDKDGELLKVQVKTGRYRNGGVEFNAYTSSRGGSITTYKGKVDKFAVWCEELDKLYLVPVEEIPTGTVPLRVDEPKHPNKNIRWARDFEV